MRDQPLVSIIIYNYNYGRYLRECIQSALDQTYENIEILVSDNASDDDSWDIITEFERNNRGKMFVARNRKNFGTDANHLNCWINRKGKYHITLCSDDVIEPTYVQKAVDLMQHRPELGFVMVHRSIIDKDGNLTHEAPFYDRSCIIHPPGQNITYMMAAVNPSVSQICYRSDLVDPRSGTGDMAGKYYASRILDFNIALDFPIAYLKESLMRHRLHGENQNLVASNDLMETIGFYVLNIKFCEEAKAKGYTELEDNFPRSVDKISELCLRYALRGLVSGDFDLGERYFHLALAFNVSAKESDFARELHAIFEDLENPDIKEKIEAARSQEGRMTRTVSYEPPKPFEEVDWAAINGV